MASKRRLPKKSLREIITDYANRKGVTILLDIKGETSEARMESPYSYFDKRKTLLIVAPLLAKRDKELLNEIIRKVFNDGHLILKAKTEELLDSYREYSSKSKDGALLEFFASILTPSDYAALKMSLYLRDQMAKHSREVSKLKEDIREKFGERGANIANLCSAGYFENYFIPLFNQLNKRDFQDEYEIAVGIKAKALFVHSSMSLEELEEEFNRMLEKAIKYRVKEFSILGLGSRNVGVIKDFVDKKANISDEDRQFFIQKRRETQNPLAIEYIVKMIQQKPS